MPFTAAEIAQHLQGEVLGDASIVLNSFAPADRAQAGDLTFAENADYFARAEQSAASAIIVDGDFHVEQDPDSRAECAHRVRQSAGIIFPEPIFPAGVHPTAIIARHGRVDPTAHIGPYCVVHERVRIGARSILQGGNHVGGGLPTGRGSEFISERHALRAQRKSAIAFAFMRAP